MLKHRPETLDIIKALSEIIHSHSDFSFSVKSRAGLNEEDKSTQLEFLREVTNYTDFISVHWRTLKQLYSWDADFSFIKHLKELVRIPIIARLEMPEPMPQSSSCDVVEKWSSNWHVK